jgi:hypothetical protein
MMMLNRVYGSGLLGVLALLIAASPASAFGRRSTTCTPYYCYDYCPPIPPPITPPNEPPVYRITLPIEPFKGPPTKVVRAVQLYAKVIVEIDGVLDPKNLPTKTVTFIADNAPTSGAVIYDENPGYEFIDSLDNEGKFFFRYRIPFTAVRDGKAEGKVVIVMNDGSTTIVPVSFLVVK